MTHRAQVVLGAASALSEDAVTNTFHFQVDPGGVAGALSALDTALIAFYNTTGTTGLTTYLSPALSRAADACSIRWYDLDDIQPRVPVRTTTFTLGGSASGSGLPDEVALCLSFQGTKVSGLNQRRRRGRLYIGPLTAASAATTSGDVRPAAALVTRLALCGETLKDAAIAANSPWSIWSQTNNSPVSVNDGWVDNAFDTQRSRGRRATARTAWS